MIKRAGQKVFFIFLILGLLGVNFALDPRKAITQYSQDVWGTKEGLPINVVGMIVQTPDNYIWCSTKEGLTRFDGARFSVFDKSNTEAMSVNVMGPLHVDRDGHLWVCTSRDLIQYKDGNFQSFSNRIPSVNSICETRAGTLWFATPQGLIRLQNKKFSEFKDNLLSGYITAIIQDRDDTLWIGTRTRGLIKFKNDIPGAFSKNSELPSAAVESLCLDKAGNLWVGTTAGLVRIKGSQLTTYTTGDGLSNNFIRCIIEDRAGCLWIGTDDGLNRFNAGRFSSYSTNDGFPTNIIFSSFEDRDGSLWLGTNGGGLVRLKEGKFDIYTSKEGLANNLVWGVHEDHAGAIWVGTQNGLSRFQGGKFTNYTTRQGLLSNNVGTIGETRDGSIWVSTFGGGLQRIKNNKIIGKYTTRDGLADVNSRVIYEDREGNLWLGSRGGGVSRFKNGRFKNYTTKEGLLTSEVFGIEQDSDGALWMAGGSGGLIRFKDGKFSSYDLGVELRSNMVFTLYRDGAGSLWIGTNGGLARLKNGKVSVFSMKQGLFDDTVFCILEDDFGCFWLTSNKGVSRVSKSDLENLLEGKVRSLSPVVYTMADGLKSNTFNGLIQPTACKDKDGRLWFATTKGLAVIDPKSIKNNLLPPPVYIQQVIADRKSVNPKVSGNLPAGTRDLEFWYTALNFLAAEKVRFKYKLEKFDVDWVEAGTRRIAYYTNIPPGEYNFRVIACNNDGVWNESGAQFSFYMQPFFYQTKLFYILCALFLIFSGLGIYRFRVRQLIAKEKHLTLLVAERTRDLNHVMKELEQLSLTDALTRLPNRRNFELIFDQEWKRCNRESQPLSLLMIDIDYFKIYNDTYGHPMGDECLKKVAAAIKQCTPRASDFPARLGGEEFIIILPNTPAAGAALMAERVRAGVEKLGIMHSGSKVNKVVTISIGGATGIPNKNIASCNLINSADQALYQAKQNGRNRFATA